jgi:hypothetical protein
MKKNLIVILLVMSQSAFSQSSSIGIPDSASNIIVPNGLVSYVITNPLSHTGSGFTNPPMAVLISPNNVSNQLYFYDLDVNVPVGATITGVEVTHKHGGGGCNSYTIDSLYLAYNGNIISSAKRDSAFLLTTNISGSSSDLWSASLTPAIVNDNSFGIILQSNTTGICTFSQADLQIEVFYTECNTYNIIGIPDSASNIIVPNGLVSYVITNPLSHTGSGFTNPPMAVLISPNNVSNQLYFYDLDVNVPVGATITGVEVTHKHGGGGCNSYTIDSLYLAYNGNIISSAKRDSAFLLTTNISGSSSDLWSASLTPAIVNDNSFGIILQSNTTGICTVSQADLQVNVFYCTTPASINSIIKQPLINIFPNPTNSELRLELSQFMVGGLYQIFDYKGILYNSGQVVNDKFIIDVSQLPNGLYIIRFEETNLKFIKE